MAGLGDGELPVELVTGRIGAGAHDDLSQPATDTLYSRNMRAIVNQLTKVHQFQLSSADILRMQHIYNAIETPRVVRGRLKLLDPVRSSAYLREVRERTLSLLEEVKKRLHVAILAVATDSRATPGTVTASRLPFRQFEPLAR